MYTFERFGTHATERVHCAHLIKYAAVQDGYDVTDSIVGLSDRIGAKYEVLDAIVYISEKEEGLWFRLRWDGLPDKRYFTLSSIQENYQDVPEMVLNFLPGDYEGIFGQRSRDQSLNFSQSSLSWPLLLIEGGMSRYGPCAPIFYNARGFNHYIQSYLAKVKSLLKGGSGWSPF